MKTAGYPNTCTFKQAKHAQVSKTRGPCLICLRQIIKTLDMELPRYFPIEHYM
jgi:hypothetical protein